MFFARLADLVLLAIANYQAAVAAGWEEKSADIVAATHVMAFLLGVLEPGGEWRVVPDSIDLQIEGKIRGRSVTGKCSAKGKDHPLVDNLTNAEQAFAVRFDEIAHTGSLICAMGATNHYAINHTTGQAKLQDFALKVARILGLLYPTDRTSVAAEVRKHTTDMLYAAAHPASKRNMLYVLDRSIPNLSAVWTPGTPRPAKGGADEFLLVRVGGASGSEKDLRCSRSP